MCDPHSDDEPRRFTLEEACDPSSGCQPPRASLEPWTEGIMASMRLHKLANGCGKPVGKWLRPGPADQRLLASDGPARWREGGLKQRIAFVSVITEVLVGSESAGEFVPMDLGADDKMEGDSGGIKTGASWNHRAVIDIWWRRPGKSCSWFNSEKKKVGHKESRRKTLPRLLKTEDTNKHLSCLEPPPPPFARGTGMLPFCPPCSQPMGPQIKRA